MAAAAIGIVVRKIIGLRWRIMKGACMRQIATAVAMCLALSGAGLLAGCATAPEAPLSMESLLQKPLYKMSPQEADRHIAHMQANIPDLRKRIAAIGRQNIGQPYVLNLLGEYPYQLHDTLPMFNLAQSDCVVFSEHTYAMALSRNWNEFFWMLQRIRYRDGVVGVATRNHYTEQDWNVNNGWLVSDVSAALAGANVATYPLTVDRTRFLRTRHNTAAQFPVTQSTESYVPVAHVHEVLAQLDDGDFVNVISSRNGEYWASHVGLVVTAPDGSRHFLNSAAPQVREETFDAFIARVAEREARQLKEGKPAQKLAGFKFLRLNDPIVVPPAQPQPRP
jgi:hypothetical protein